MEISKVHQETLESALTSLLKWHTTKSSTQKPQLLPTDEFIYLVLTLHKIPPKPKTNAFKIPLPNPLFSPKDTEICLIIDDKKIPSKSAKKKVLDEQIPVSKIIKFSKLKTDYKAFELKRKLCNSYELFFADKRVVPLLPKVIGKVFYKRKKVPVPIELGKKGWKERIERVCGSALFFMGSGSCCVLKVGKVSMSKDEILENLRGVIDGVVEFVPRKWGNVRSFHLKLSDSVALPVYQALPEMLMKISVGGGDGEKVRGVESEGSEKKGKGVVKKKKGRIHEVRYMDSVVVDEMVGDDDDDVGEMGSEEESKKVAKKKKKGRTNEDCVAVGEKVGDDGEMGSAEIGVKKRKKGDDEKKKAKKVTKVEKVDKGLKQKKAKGSTEKKSKKVKTVV